MAEVWHVFQACGFASWVCMLAAVLATPLSMLAFAVVLGRARGAKIIAGIALIASLFPVGIGAIARATGRARVDAALEGQPIDPAFVERIRVEGYKEADGCVLVGAASGGFALVVALLAVGLVLVRPPRPQS